MDYPTIWRVTSHELIEDSDRLCENRTFDFYFRTKEAAIECATEYPGEDECIELTRMETDEHDCFVPMDTEILHVGNLWVQDINLKLKRGCLISPLEQKMLMWNK